MKKFYGFPIVACFLFLFTLLFPSARGLEDASQTGGCHGIGAQVPLNEPTRLAETADGVIVYDLMSDTLLYAWRPDETIEPSSMAKVMTALLALEKGDMDAVVTASRTALDTIPPGSVSAKLKAGEQMRLEDLLYCMITASANDASAVIAEHIGGSIPLFVDMMNDRAQELGCTATHFVNPHGISEEGEATTTRDLGRILIAALENPDFRALFTAISHDIPATNVSEARTVRTTNYMMSREVNKLYFDSRITGGKTGSGPSGRCLAATSQGNGMELLTLVMGATPTYEEDTDALATFGSFEETAALLDYFYETYEFRQVFLEGQVVSQLPVENGANSVALTPVQSLSTVLPLEVDETKLRWVHSGTAETLTAPVTKGQALGYEQVWYEDCCLVQTDLVAANDVAVWAEPKIPERTLDGGTLATLSALKQIGGALGILAVLALAGFGGFLLIQRLRRGPKPTRKRRRNRAISRQSRERMQNSGQNSRNSRELPRRRRRRP